MKPKWAFLYLYIPIIIAVILDYALTMDGNREYFLGKITTVNEVAPLGRFLLLIGPTTFTACIIIYLAAACWLMKVLPEGIKLFCYLLVTYLHAYGAESWIDDHISASDSSLWIFHVAFVAGLTILVTVFLRAYQTARVDPGNPRVP